MVKASIIIENCKDCPFCGTISSGFDLFYICEGVKNRPSQLNYTTKEACYPIIEKCIGQSKVNIPEWCPNSL